MKITGVVESVEQKHGTSKAGKPWTLSRVKINGTTYSTFDAPPPVGRTVEAEVEQDGKYWNLNAWSVRTDNPAPSGGPAGGSTPHLSLRQKLIVRENALTNDVATLKGTDPGVRLILTVADQYYRWVTKNEMPPEEVPESKVPEPAGGPQPTPPVEAYNDDIPF